MVVWNRSVDKCEQLASEYPGQVTIASSPKDVVRVCTLPPLQDYSREVFRLIGYISEPSFQVLLYCCTKLILRGAVGG